ncbi:MAG: YggT family protein [Anaerolineae bacterium]
MNLLLANLINLAIEIMSLLILVEVIGSWVMLLRVNLPDVVYDLLRAVHSVTGIILNPIRSVIPSLGGLDISPIVALILLDVIRRVLVTALLR